MRRQLVILSIALFFLACFAGTSYAIAISQSSGTMTVNWSDYDGIVWEEEIGIFTLNGADADNGVATTSDYPGSYVNNATAAFGSEVVGQASTSLSSVSSSAYIYNDGTGFNQSASGTSHINRSFTSGNDGYYIFSANYVFTDLISLSDSSESASGYHHFDISIWDEGVQSSVTEAFSVGSGDDLPGSLSIGCNLIAGKTYSLEIHTYNSANAYSPYSEPVSSVPEPATGLLLTTGLLGLVGLRPKKFL